MRAPFCLPCVFVVFFVLLSYSSSAYVILSLAENTTLVSPRKVFELGFFNHAFISSRWYLGIWYRNDPNRTHLWVANSKPLVGSNETLRLWENNLFLVNQDNSTVWSTNLTGRGVRASQTVAVLLDNGNFVLKDPNNINNNPDDFLWQSFDSPTDTLLPEMKLGFDPKNGIEKFLTLWDSSYSPVFYTFKLKNQSGLFELFVCDTETSHCHYRSDPWDGIRFDDNLPLEQASNTTFLMTGSNVNSRLTLSDWGSLEAYTWAEEKMEPYTTWSSDVDKCNAYRTCPTYSYCSSPTKKDARSECPCFKGFDPMVEEQSQAYCRRRTKLSCRGDGFLHLNNMKLPDTKNVSVNMELDFQNCKESCLRECECTAFAYVSIGKGQLGCVRWSGDLNDMRKYTLGGKDLYVRLAAKDLPGLEDSGKNIGQIVGYVIAGLVVIVSLVIFCYWKKHKRRIQERRRSTESEIAMNEIVRPESFQLMDFGVIAQATDNFSEGNKLGQGGFGSVFKGTLPDGKEVAVKRLKARSSQSQGITEFNNEVTMILRVLHVNLVRLLGCCSEGDEKILVYEYHGNSSLNRYLFDKTQSSLLNWAQRYKIMKGIAEGLSYLHYFTSPPILHRDLKPSNILLDKDMIPKISDFGLAQMLEIGTTEAETERAVGTYGYMPEEYALHHSMSEKSDIFSYGVLLLETVTGKRNVDYCNRNPGDSLLDYVKSHEGASKLEYKPGVLDDFFMQSFRKKLVEEVGSDSEKPGYVGLIDLVKLLLLKGRTRSETNEAAVRILKSLFPPLILELYKLLIAPIARGKIAALMVARVTVLTCQWLMGPCKVNTIDLPNGESWDSGVFVEKCQYLEESKCVGVCINTCKLPTQTFFKDYMGVPLLMEPDFRDYSCQFKFGVVPPKDDANVNEPCLETCSIAGRRKLNSGECPMA